MKFFKQLLKSQKWEENFLDESLDEDKQFKNVFGVGCEFQKIWIKIKNIRAMTEVYWLL